MSERLNQLKACLSRPLAARKGGVIVTYDIIQVYKTLVLSCGISLEGNCEDPKVSAPHPYSFILTDIQVHTATSGIHKIHNMLSVTCFP